MGIVTTSETIMKQCWWMQEFPAGKREKRMANLRLSMDRVKAIFISHEHIDHIRGVAGLAKKYELPVYITAATLKNSPIHLDKHLHCSFKANEPVIIGGLSVIPFVKKHDARDPYSFMIENKGTRVGIITDIGIACKDVIHYFKQCHACFLESNYDEQMLEDGGYPIHLKKRIRGGNGHLSNKQALELFIHHRPAYMSHLILSHLSKNNNDPGIVEELFSSHARKTTIVVASRYNETEVYAIRKPANELTGIKQVILKKESVQMRMFE